MEYCKDHRQGDFEPSSLSNLGFGTQPLGPHFSGNRTHFFLGEPSVSTQSRMAFDQCNQSSVSQYISILKLCYNGRVPVEKLAEGMRGTRVYVRITLKLPRDHKEKTNIQSNGDLFNQLPRAPWTFDAFVQMTSSSFLLYQLKSYSFVKDLFKMFQPSQKREDPLSQNESFLCSCSILFNIFKHLPSS